mmetsp:Transcript_10767/g.49533  ORF Transcript_10767/g.49533 Transcript_10767/m.49533 type:complete len:363 (+) Transcript_10767:69-1157(+)
MFGIARISIKRLLFSSLILFLCCSFSLIAKLPAVVSRFRPWKNPASVVDARNSLAKTTEVSCSGTWRGEPESKKHAFRENGPPFSIDLVVAHCVDSLSWIPAWTGEFHVRSFTIYSRCNSTVTGVATDSAQVIRNIPNLGREGYVWMYHILRLPPETPSDRVTLFLTDTHFRRPGAASCKDMYFGAKSHLGFSCGTRPQMSSWSLFNSKSLRHSEHSIWHDSSSLSRPEIQSDYFSQTHDYKEFNDAQFILNPSLSFISWLKQMNISLWDSMTPVCYGGSFATTVKALRTISKERAAGILHSLSRGSNIIEGHFFERVIASLLTSKQNFDTVQAIRGISKGFCSSHCGGRNGIFFGCKKGNT